MYLLRKYISVYRNYYQDEARINKQKSPIQKQAERKKRETVEVFNLKQIFIQINLICQDIVATEHSKKIKLKRKDLLNFPLRRSVMVSELTWLI